MTKEGAFVNKAKIIITDIKPDNGVCHAIDSVFMPPGQETQEPQGKRLRVPVIMALHLVGLAAVLDYLLSSLERYEKGPDSSP